MGMSEITRILDAAGRGDPHAAEQLLPLVYDELRRLAAAQMAREKPGQTLDPTALVHEAYLRLVKEPDAQARESWDNRRHFFAAAATAMQRILVENARRRHSEKRGGGRDRLALDPDRFAAPEQAEDLVALDEALELLTRAEPEVAELVRLRYFAGLTVPQAEEVLDVSPRTADTWWAFARAWLLAKVRGESV
jgi:RNA polymerase sigma factor (TIGR02999 family)